MDEYKAMYQQSIDDPSTFWAGIAEVHTMRRRGTRRCADVCGVAELVLEEECRRSGPGV